MSKTRVAVARYLRRPLAWIKSCISAGYAPHLGPTAEPVLYGFGETGSWGELRVNNLRARLPSPKQVPRVGMVLPTYVARVPIVEYRELLQATADQLRRVTKLNRNLWVVFFLGIQWDQGQQEEARRRIALSAALFRDLPRIVMVGLEMRRCGKVATLNAAFDIATQLELNGVGWIDDDVVLGPDCLSVMIARFLARGAQGSVGARKVPHARHHVASRILDSAKRSMSTPSTAYPHGCCMMVDADLVRKGIPRRYSCDDGYFCFALVAPQSAQPMGAMEVVTAAECHHCVGGPAPEIYLRVRRSLLSAIVYLADYPLDVSRFYFREVIFRGLWPLAPFDGNRGLPKGLLKLTLKWIYFVWFLEVGGELLVRGLLRRPLRGIDWAAYKEREAPTVDV